MHECWECGAYCWCDMDDTMLNQPKDCRHRCAEYDDLDESLYDDETDDIIGGGEL